MLLKRLDVTVQSFGWSERAKVRLDLDAATLGYLNLLSACANSFRLNRLFTSLFALPPDHYTKQQMLVVMMFLQLSGDKYFQLVICRITNSVFGSLS